MLVDLYFFFFFWKKQLVANDSGIHGARGEELPTTILLSLAQATSGMF